MKGEWRSFKVKRVRKAEKKTDLFLRRLLQSKKVGDRLSRNKYKKDTAVPNDKNVRNYREVADEVGVEAPERRPMDAEEKNMWDKMVNALKDFKDGVLDSEGFQKARNVFKRFINIRRENYQAYHQANLIIEQNKASGISVIEAVEIPVFLEDNIQYTINEADELFMHRVKEWLNRHKESLPEVARRAFDFLKSEGKMLVDLPEKLKNRATYLIDHIKKSLRGEKVPPSERQRAAEVMRDFLHYIGLGAIAFMPSPPGMSVLAIAILRLIERMTSLPIFPKSWADSGEEDKKRLGFNEMAAGPIGGGAATSVDPDRFPRLSRQIAGIINMELSNGRKPIKLGQTRGGQAYMIGSDFSGVVIATTTDAPFHEVTEDVDEFTFVAKYFEEDEHNVLGGLTISIQNPQVRPDMMGQGIAFEIYSALGKEYNILADNTQSKEGRYLWAKLVKERAFQYVYVYNELTDEIEEEISGNFERFRELMADGDPEIRFIGSIRRKDIDNG